MYIDLLRFTIKSLADIYDAKVSNVNGDPFGHVNCGSLTVYSECCNVYSYCVLLLFLDERDFQDEGNAVAWRSYTLN